MVLLQVLERWHALLSETTTKLRAAKAALQGPVWALALRLRISILRSFWKLL